MQGGWRPPESPLGEATWASGEGMENLHKELPFHLIKDVVREFLVDDQCVELVDIQPCHMGQANVYFVHIYNCDAMIANGPHVYNDIMIIFVKHNPGRNWRVVNFNQESWMLLMGYPLD